MRDMIFKLVFFFPPSSLWDLTWGTEVFCASFPCEYIWGCLHHPHPYGDVMKISCEI